MRTEEQLNQLAKDLVSGLIFTDRQIENFNDVGMVFLPIALMEKEQIEKLRDENPALIFEYLEKAGPRGVNGMPCFASFQYLNQEEWDKVFAKYTKLKEAMEAALKT